MHLQFDNDKVQNSLMKARGVGGVNYVIYFEHSIKPSLLFSVINLPFCIMLVWYTQY